MMGFKPGYEAVIYGEDFCNNFFSNENVRIPIFHNSPFLYEERFPAEQGDDIVSQYWWADNEAEMISYA